ncbi:unnamed protein product [Orchesella dallaii]|uniref:Uncharacterized protein n=1 Tax=Orchesella dallaii TaxID=48710 RepID=A0ABP1RER8_9HEXA
MESLRRHKNGSQNDLSNEHSSTCGGSILCDVAKLVAGINRISKRLSRENSEDLSKQTSQVDSSEVVKRKDRNGKGRRLCSSNCHLLERERKACSKDCSEEIISRKYYHSGGGCCIQRKCDNEDASKVFDREDRKCHPIQNECYCNRDRYQRRRCSIDDSNYRCCTRPQTAICGCRDRCDDDHYHYSSVPNRRLCSTACESRKYHDDQHHCSYHKNGNGQNRRLDLKLVEFISETAKLIQNAKEDKEKERKDILRSNLYKQPGEAMNGIELEKEFQEIKSSTSSRKNSTNADVTNSSQKGKADQNSKSGNSNLEEMTFQIIPSPAQKEKEKESQKGKTEGGNPAETTNLNYIPPQLKERYIQSSTNVPGTKRNVNGTDNNENNSSPFGNGSPVEKITIENPQLQQFIGDVLSAINEIQEEDEDPFCSSPCSRETSCDNCISQKSETMPLQHATDIRCRSRTKRPRVCSYFIPVCLSSGPSQCQPYCHSNQIQDSQNSIMPLQESFQQNNTVCFQRVKWREQCLTNSRQSARQAQQCPNQINNIQGLRRCPPSATAGSANRQRGLRNVGQQQSPDVCDTITYFVPPHRTYWQNM